MWTAVLIFGAQHKHIREPGDHNYASLVEFLEQAGKYKTQRKLLNNTKATNRISTEIEKINSQTMWEIRLMS